MITPLTATSEQLLAAYRDGARILRESIEGMSPEQLRARPVPGKLSSIEVVAHIVDSDQFMCDRIKRTIALDRPLIVGVESIAYPVPLRYQDRDIDLDIDLLEIQRRQLARDLESLPESIWARDAVHTENGLQTLHAIFHHAVEHLEGHVLTIAEKRAVLGV